MWLERKIFPESVLRHYIDGIGGSNDDASAGFSLRRPSQSERAIDDPIREMEGMLVDEYGRCVFLVIRAILFNNISVAFFLSLEEHLAWSYILLWKFDVYMVHDMVMLKN